MPSRLQRQFHVTGTQYISTDKVQSQTLNTGGTAETFSPWANKPRAFFTIFIYQGQKVVRACFNLSHQTRRPTLGRISAAPFCPTLYWPTHSSDIYLFSGAFAGVVVILRAWGNCVMRKNSNLSERSLQRSEFCICPHVFSRFPHT